MDLPDGPPELSELLARRDLVHRLARRLLADEHAAEDVTQEALALALASSRPRRLAYWLGALRELARKERRSRARRDRRERLAARPESRPATDAILAREEWRRRVVECVLELDPSQREVVLLRYFDGLPPRAIAKRLAQPVDVVKARLARGLAKLRPELARGRERSEWFEGLALLAVPARGAASLVTQLGTGALVMSQGSKAAIVALAALGALGLWFATHGIAPSAEEPRELAETPAGVELPVERNDASSIDDLGASRVALEVGAAREGARPALVGRVVAKEDDAPLAGVAVALQLGERVETRVSDAGGGFELALEAPARLVAARVAPGERSAAHDEALDLALEPNGARELVLRIPRGVRVVGRVLDPAGEPVVGAEAVGWCAREGAGDPARRARVDAEGRFALEHLGEDFRVEARASGWMPANAVVGASGALKETEELVLRLARPASLRVVVRDEGGAPLEGVEVRAAPRGPGWNAGLTRSEDVRYAAPAGIERSGVTDARGELELGDLAAVEQHVDARLADFAPWSGSATPGGEPLAIVLARGATIEGVVLRSDGRPAVGAEVEVRGYSLLEAARTDGAGRFAIAGVQLRNRQAWLGIRAEGQAAYVREPLRERDSPLRIQLEPARAIAGVLRCIDGAPAANAAVRIEGDRLVQGEVDRSMSVFPTWESLVLGLTEVRTDAEGRFRFDGLYEGAFELSVFYEHEGIERRQAWQVRSGDEALDLRLDPERFDDVVLEGHVRDALTGQPLREFTATVIGGKIGIIGNAGSFNGPPRTFRDEAGAYRIGGIPPMQVGVFVSASGYRDQGVIPTPRAPGTHTVDVELFPVRSVTVRVVGPDGGPLVGACLFVSDRDGNRIWMPVGTGGMVGMLTTDSRGEAILQNLPASRIGLFVSPPIALRKDPSNGNEGQRFELDVTAQLEDVQVLHLELP